MRYLHCPYSHKRKIRCYEDTNKNCPMEMKGWMDVVLQWAMSSHNGRSLDPSVVLGGLNIGGSESSAVWSAGIYCLFDDPDSVMGWMQEGEKRQAPITPEICADLRQAGGKWLKARAKWWAELMQECLESVPNRQI